MAKKEAQQGIVRPKNLSFSRSINISEGKFWQTTWEKRRSVKEPLLIFDKAVLASKSYEIKGDVDKEALEPNPQRSQACALSTEHDTFRLDFSLKVLPVAKQLNSCGDVNYRELLDSFIETFRTKNMYLELAQRYVNNIANARFLWRNRRGASRIETIISVQDKEYIFNSKDFSLDTFVYDDDGINEIAGYVSEALSGATDFLDFCVTCFAQVGCGMEVFPSQEMVMDDGEENLGKVLFEYEGSAGMHSQKIGNALRTIDTWYADYDKYQFPISVENYGANRTLHLVFRNRSKSFYALLDKYIDKPAEAPAEDMLYLMAVIIRGGLFGSTKGAKDV